MSLRPKDTFNTQPIWNNQDLTLYHGTTFTAANAITAGKIDVEISSSNKDFGRGFYTTCVRRQAESWAKIVVGRRKERGLPYEVPTLAVIVIPRAVLSDLRTLSFTLAGADQEDFWSFVRHNRRLNPNHLLPQGDSYSSYDVVYGPLVLDWEYRRVYPSGDQVSFHTVRSQSLLNNDTKRSIIEVE